MIADMEAYEKLSPIVPGLFLKGKKINISLVFISQYSFKVSKTIRLNVVFYHTWKRELQPTALNHSSDIDFKDFMKFYQDNTKEPFSLLLKDTTLPLENP